MPLWYLSCFDIIDLCTQLENAHKKQNNQTCFTVYRDQSRLPKTELAGLQSNIGGLTSTNGFLSTSTNHDSAAVFVLDAQDKIGFNEAFSQITVDANRLKNLVFI